MKDKKIFLFIGLAALAAWLFLSLFRAKDHKQPGPASIETSAARLEAQVKSLQDLLRGFVHINRSLKNTFLWEKKQREDLEALIKGVSSQNQALREELGRARDELSRAKASLEFTGNIRQRIRQTESSLEGLKLSPGKETEVKNLLREINKNLSSIDTRIPGLLKENTDYKSESLAKGEALKKQEKEIADLKGRLREEETQKLALKNNLNILKGQISETEKELKNREEELSRVIRGKEQAIKETLEALEKLKKEEEANKGLQNDLAKLKEEKERLSKDVASAQAASQNTQNLKDELKRLQALSEQMGRDFELLKTEHKNSEEVLKQNSAELGRRAEKILALTEKLADVELKLQEIQERSRGIEKESALLREQNVSVQLEREDLKSQIAAAQAKLSDMESRAAQITSLLKTSSGAETVLPKDEAKNVEVEVYPAKEGTLDEERQ